MIRKSRLTRIKRLYEHKKQAIPITNKQQFEKNNDHDFLIDECRIRNIKYIKFSRVDSLIFYIDKMKQYIDILKSQYCNLEISPIDINYLCFNVRENLNYYHHDFDTISNWIDTSHSNDLFLFDELAFPELLSYSIVSKENHDRIIEFLKRSNYIVFFCELFENDQTLNTIGNSIHNLEYTLHFFKYAKRVYLCNINNISILFKHGIRKNIVYFPPCGYSKLYDYNVEKAEKDIDVLFYGNGIEVMMFRKKTLESLNEYLTQKGKNLMIKNELHEEKNQLLSRTRIVIHIPMLEFQRSVPWAKCAELILKRAFFMVYDNIESMNFVINRHFDFPVFNKSFDNICHYLNNDLIREDIVNYNYNQFIYLYNSDILMKSLTIQKNIFKTNQNKYNVNKKYSKIKMFNFDTLNYHALQKKKWKELFQSHGVVVEYIKMSFLDDSHQYFPNYIKDSDCLYIFNAEDYYHLFCLLDPRNVDIFISFLNNCHYLHFQYEIIINSELDQIQLSTHEPNVYCNKIYYCLEDRLKFSKFFYLNAKKVFCSNDQSLQYLQSAGVTNTVYFPPVGFSERTNSIMQSSVTQRDIDVLFYGSTSHEFTHRSAILNCVKEYCESKNYVYMARSDLYDEEEKNNILSRSKIIIHVPSYSGLQHFPWAKCTELISKRIFFIIEDFKETCGFKDLLVTYNDTNDLLDKIDYYINNFKDRQSNSNEILKYCMDNYHENEILKAIHFSSI